MVASCPPRDTFPSASYHLEEYYHIQQILWTLFLLFSHTLTVFSSRIRHVLRLFSDISESIKHTSFAPWHYTLSDVNKGSVYMPESYSTLWRILSSVSFTIRFSYKMAVRWGTPAVLLHALGSFSASVWHHGTLTLICFLKLTVAGHVLPLYQVDLVTSVTKFRLKMESLMS